MRVLIGFILALLIVGNVTARQNAQLMFDQANTLLEENDFLGA